MATAGRGVALIVGCASNVWADVEAACTIVRAARATPPDQRTFDAIYCVKQMGIHWPNPFDVWATLHPEVMDEYEAERRALGYPGGYEIVAPQLENWMHGDKGNISRRVDYRYKGMNSSASSGIYAAKIALDDGFRAVLAGIPMDKNAGHFLPHTKTIVSKQTRGTVWMEKETFDVGFEFCIPHMRGKVKSMSGHTRSVFGEPTPDWLRGDPLPVNSAEARA